GTEAQRAVRATGPIAAATRTAQDRREATDTHGEAPWKDPCRQGWEIRDRRRTDPGRRRSLDGRPDAIARADWTPRAARCPDRGGDAPGAIRPRPSHRRTHVVGQVGSLEAIARTSFPIRGRRMAPARRQCPTLSGRARIIYLWTMIAAGVVRR